MCPLPKINSDFYFFVFHCSYCLVIQCLFLLSVGLKSLWHIFVNAAGIQKGSRLSAIT